MKNRVLLTFLVLILFFSISQVSAIDSDSSEDLVSDYSDSVDLDYSDCSLDGSSEAIGLDYSDYSIDYSSNDLDYSDCSLDGSSEAIDLDSSNNALDDSYNDLDKDVLIKDIKHYLSDDSSDENMEESPVYEDFPNIELYIHEVGPEKVHLGETFEVSFVVWPLDGIAYNTVVFFEIPSGFELVSYTMTQGDYNEERSMWEIVNIPEGGNAKFALKLKALKEGTFTLKAYAFTDSYNLNPENSTVKAKIQVVGTGGNSNSVEKNGKLDDSKGLVLYETGNPIFVLILSCLSLFSVYIGRKY
ncbi:BatD family protein [uncultured Methanobrevibacter sp.]|uniref:BatD family protein n=1 Tax=uncultured Methanobrevibacter sp. TaxID=253161 RepID=UPI00261FF2D3